MESLENKLSHAIIGAAIEVHRELGAGLLESAYASCLAREFDLRGIKYQMELAMPIEYKGLKVECGYRLDFLVEDSVIIELKAVRTIDEIDEAQCLTYLKFSGKKLCLLINFRTLLLKDGIKRIVHNL